MTSAVTAASPREILRLRLASQRIDAPTSVPADPTGTVRHLFAMQAQDLPQALWAVGLRTPGATRDSVLAALADGSVVRSSPLRGTLTLLAAEDLRWMLALTADRSAAGPSARHRELEIDETTVGRAREVAEAELTGGVTLDRTSFLGVLDRAGIRTDGQRGYHLIWLLAQRGIVCWGPPSGTQQTLVLVDEWIAPTPALERDEALGRFVRRYFAGHGPATVRDLAWWSKLTLADVRLGLSLARPDLMEITANGTSYWMAADARGATTARRVHALPGFDEYLLGYQDRSLALAAEHANLVVPGNNGIFRAMILVDGRIVGTWRRSPTRSVAAIDPQPFGRLSARDAAGFDREVARYRAFLTPGGRPSPSDPRRDER